MTEIKAALVKELREETNVGMMECKKALIETQGDKEAAVKLLRERGLAIAGKKAGRTTNEGVVASEIFEGGKVGVMIEVNCETDFVARNDTFQSFVKGLLRKAKELDGVLADTVTDEVTAKIAEIGENIIVRRNVRYALTDNGIIATYIHFGGKVGVLLEVGCDNPDTVQNEIFRETVKDITLHIAASNPLHLNRDTVPEAEVAAEREIYVNQVEGKPENIVDKIVSGKLEKYYGQICLLEQGFVKDPDHTVGDLLAAKNKELGDTMVIRRYTRYHLGEE